MIKNTLFLSLLIVIASIVLLILSYYFEICTNRSLKTETFFSFFLNKNKKMKDKWYLYDDYSNYDYLRCDNKEKEQEIHCVQEVQFTKTLYGLSTVFNILSFFCAVLVITEVFKGLIYATRSSRFKTFRYLCISQILIVSTFLIFIIVYYVELKEKVANLNAVISTEEDKSISEVEFSSGTNVILAFLILLAVYLGFICSETFLNEKYVKQLELERIAEQLAKSGYDL